MEARRSYTLEEANGELPRLRELLPRLQEARRSILEAGEVVKGVAEHNGGGPEGATYMRALRTLRAGLESLSRDGIILRDSDTGLVDFPSEREGREVFLCWRLGEAEIGHWHEVDAGMAGRRPL